MDDAAADVPKRLFIPTFSLLLDGHVAPTAYCPTVLPRTSPGLTSVSRKRHKRRGGRPVRENRAKLFLPKSIRRNILRPLPFELTDN